MSSTLTKVKVNLIEVWKCKGERGKRKKIRTVFYSVIEVNAKELLLVEQ